jgi:hypothetical protein
LHASLALTETEPLLLIKVEPVIARQEMRPLAAYGQSAPAFGALFTAQLAGAFTGFAVSGAVTNSFGGNGAGGPHNFFQNSKFISLLKANQLCVWWGGQRGVCFIPTS